MCGIIVPAMKAKKQTLYPLRFETAAQRQLVKRAAKMEHRSMNNYILRTVLAKASEAIAAIPQPEQVTA